MFNGLNYQIIDRIYKKYPHQVLEFDNMEEEVHYIAHKISQLLEKGISIDKIKLANVTEEYYNTIERIFSMYNLKAAINYQIPLLNYQLVKDFLAFYQKDELKEALDKVNNSNNKVFNELINIINKYYKYNDKNLLIYKIEHSYLNCDKYTNSIEIIDYLDYETSNDEYVFLLGFNEGIIPKYQNDTNYITDNIANEVGLNTTKETNSLIKENTIKAIADIKNLIITYKLRDFKNSYYPSTLCEIYEVKKEEISYNITYSEIYDKLLLTKSYDEYYKYGTENNNLNILKNNYQIKYNSYSNKFTGINRAMDKLNLSYSKMQIYNKCAFRYYLTHILKLDIYKENFSTIIGNMVHSIMEKCLSNNNMDIDTYATEFLKDKKFTKKEQFFLQKYKEAIHELLAEVMLEKEYSLFNEAMYEKEIDIDYGNNVHFIGIIDKILYYIDDSTTYVSLIDYKTGMDDISLKYLKYGLNIQLPIYLYLSTKISFNNVKYCGFYLQRFNIVNKDYRLIGYTSNNSNALKVMDKNYYNSKIIKGLKTNNDGSFSKNSKILSDDDIDKIKEEAAFQITKVIDNIKKNNFEINPKTSEEKNIGCEYCKYKDICFVKKDDEIEIKPIAFGGDT